ncbi:type II secretion system protein N [Thalassotalea sp. PS06]|uniref:type II secretion system protein N n=1 Tax=Thalassotalea sp. PS06 TaxID=2594005 RepID=UPI00116332EC|nr:type II secretion system protein N [Thalassotalea sp. PS06]QDP00027.1 type II secretion system protein N [Thalassotalea sp. PS06]
MSIKKGMGYGLGFLAVYLVFVIAMAPAKKLVALIELPQDVVLHGVDGTVWSGEAQSMSTSNYEIKDVDWSLSPLSLLTMSPSADVNFGRSPRIGPTGNLTIRNDHPYVGLHDADIKIEAGRIVNLVTLPVDMTASGLVSVDLQTFITGKEICTEVAGDITWQQASVNAFDEEVALGDFKGKLSCENNSLAITLDPDNDLGLELSVYISQRGRIAAQGYLKPGPKFPESARPLLTMGFLGKKDNQGRYRIRI